MHNNKNQKARDALNLYFSNNLWFERKFYYWRPAPITRQIKMRDEFLTNQLLAFKSFSF